MNESRALLVCAGGGIGDAFMASIVARALRQRFQRVDAFALETQREILERSGELDSVVVDPKTAHGETAQALRSRRYDAALVTWATLRNALLPYSAGIPARVGQARRLYSFLFTKRVVVRSERGDRTSHWSQILLDYARALDCDTGDAAPRIRISPEDRAAAAALVAPLRGQPYVVVHPTNGISPLRPLWPTEGWVSLAARIVRERGFKVVLTGTANDRPIVREIAERTGCLDVAGRTSLGALAALTAGARCALMMDGGAMHVAAAAGAATVGIFPLQTHFPDRWAPLGPRTAVVRPSYPCRPGERMETCPDYACVRNLAVGEILAAFDRLVGAA